MFVLAALYYIIFYCRHFINGTNITKNQSSTPVTLELKVNILTFNFSLLKVYFIFVLIFLLLFKLALMKFSVKHKISNFN